MLLLAQISQLQHLQIRNMFSKGVLHVHDVGRGGACIIGQSSGAATVTCSPMRASARSRCQRLASTLDSPAMSHITPATSRYRLQRLACKLPTKASSEHRLWHPATSLPTCELARVLRHSNDILLMDRDVIVHMFDFLLDMLGQMRFHTLRLRFPHMISQLRAPPLERQ